MQRVAALPVQALLRVVRGPDVVRRQRVDRTRVRDQVAGGDLGPGADAHPLRLRDAAVLEQRLRRRLVVRPHTLLERPGELREMRLADQVVPLVVERGVEEEAVVLDLEVLVLFADPAFTQGEELLALGERTHGYGPFLECNWHRREKPPKRRVEASGDKGGAGRGRHIVTNGGACCKGNFKPNSEFGLTS